MSNFYTATTPFTFVDSQFGTAATSTGITLNVPKIWDIKYHKKVQIKTFFQGKGLIGPDTYTEGKYDVTTPGYPVIRKTDFQGKKGDTIIMHQRTNLDYTKNKGMVGQASQLVNAEVGWDLNNKMVKMEQHRQAVLTVGGMNEQRNPVTEPFVQTEDDLLADWTAQTIDSGLHSALHYGHSYHLFRGYYNASAASGLTPTANANTIFGNDQTLTAQTITSSTSLASYLDPSGSRDNLGALTFELGERYMDELYADPVTIGGDAYWVVLVSSAAWHKMIRDKDIRDAMLWARERGIDNPLFKNSGAFIYSNCIIMKDERIRTLIAAYNPAGLSVANVGAYNSTITESAYTLPSGVAAGQVHQTYFLGANALALAEGRMRMADRKEDDYGQFIGRDADNIWGASRMDWNDTTATFSNNVSSLCIVNTLI